MIINPRTIEIMYNCEGERERERGDVATVYIVTTLVRKTLGYKAVFEVILKGI